MKVLLAALLLIQFTAQSQPLTKKVLIEGKGAPIVLLNGGTLDMTAFAQHSKLLSDSFTVIRMEQFNIQYATEGLTLPDNYSVKTESDAIKATLDSLKQHEQIVLVGHSYGGVIAFDFALNHPDRVKSLVLIEPPLFDIPKANGEQPEGMKRMEELSKQFTPGATITEEMIERFRCNLLNCDTFNIREHPMWTKWVSQKNRHRGLAAVANYHVDFKKLKSFRKPVLIVTASETVAFHKRIDELLAAQFENATAASMQGGHTSIYQKPDAFVKLLTAFIRQ